MYRVDGVSERLCPAFASSIARTLEAQTMRHAVGGLVAGGVPSLVHSLVLWPMFMFYVFLFVFCFVLRTLACSFPRLHHFAVQVFTY